MAQPAIERVMIIDDERIDQMMYNRIIKRSGLVGEVLNFTLAHDAVAYFKQADAPPVDLIFLDINMPLMNGFEFLEAVEAYIPDDVDLPVIMMLTTSMNSADRARAEQFSRVRSFFNKPLSQDLLEGAVSLVAGPQDSAA